MREAFTSGCALTLVSWLAASCAPRRPGPRSSPVVPLPPSPPRVGPSSPLPPEAPLTVLRRSCSSPRPPSTSRMRTSIPRGSIPDGCWSPLFRTLHASPPSCRWRRRNPTCSDSPRGRTHARSPAPIDSLWKMSFLFFDIYKTLTGVFGIADPSAEVGFAATNGMLSTLDSRSKLLTGKEYEAASKLCRSCAANPPVAVLTSHMLSSGIGYLRLRSLPGAASSGVRQALGIFSAPHRGRRTAPRRGA